MLAIPKSSIRQFATHLTTSSLYPPKVIGILGGLGPSAGLALHKRIIQNTKSNLDQDHLPVLHSSFSSFIPDRSAFILHQSTFNPAYDAFNVLGTLVRASNFPETELFVVIFNEFLELSNTAYPGIHILNMVELTAEHISKVYPRIKKVGLLSTSGTRKSNVYGKTLEKYGLEIVQLEEEKQPLIHDVIYNPIWGIKAQSPVSPRAQQNLHQLILQLIEHGAECIILGCTELPLAMPFDVIRNIPVIDPMRHLARALIYRVDPSKLKEFTCPLRNNLSKGLGFAS